MITDKKMARFLSQIFRKVKAYEWINLDLPTFEDKDFINTAHMAGLVEKLPSSHREHRLTSKGERFIKKYFYGYF